MSNKKSGKTVNMEENILNVSSRERASHQKGAEKRGSSGSTDSDSKIKTYGLINNVQETEQFLLDNPEIIKGSTAVLLLQWCTAITDDPDSFNNVSRQCIYIIYLYDLSRLIDIEPVHCVTPFFDKINEPTFRERFEREIDAYRSRLQALTFNEVLDEVLIPSPEEDVSSSGDSTTSSEGDTCALDPLEVYDNLPDRIKECLDDEDLYALEHEFSELPHDQAMHYFVQMVKSGLLLSTENKTNEDHEEVDDNLSDIKFDSESKSSNEKYAELLECLQDVDLEQISEDLDKDDDTIGCFDSDE